MKRIISLLLSVLIISAFALPVFANDTFTIDEYGNVTEYHGDYPDSINIPSKIDGKAVKKLADGLFKGDSVGSIYVNPGFEEIGESCFEGSSIEYINIPETLIKVGDDAFKNCRSLTSFALYSDSIKFGNDALAGTGYLNIAVPCTADLITLYDKIYDAKGDGEFAFDIMHTGIVESLVERDGDGSGIITCYDCGYTESEHHHDGEDYPDDDGNQEIINPAADIKLPFIDVKIGAWYYKNVYLAYADGIINGKSSTLFDPDAYMTLAEAAKIAACVHMKLNGRSTDVLKEGGAWYTPYTDYCSSVDIIESGKEFDWNKSATRAEMAYLFSRAGVVGNDKNAAVQFADIPDVDENSLYSENILALYRKGIVVGSNEYLAYYPDAFVKRSEVAAIISRILHSEMRIELPKG